MIKSTMAGSSGFKTANKVGSGMSISPFNKSNGFY